jgi:hypothetical protein
MFAVTRCALITPPETSVTERLESATSSRPSATERLEGATKRQSARTGEQNCGTVKPKSKRTANPAR